MKRGPGTSPVEKVLEGPVPEGFFLLPGPFRMLLGLDGTLTRSLTFLSGEGVEVEPVLLPDAPDGIRKVYLRVPSFGRLVFARTRLLPGQGLGEDPWIATLMRGDLAIGQSMEARYGPLLKDEFSVFSVLAPFDPHGPQERGEIWARSYRMRTREGLSLRIEEFFLPPLLRLAGAGFP